MLQNVSSVYPSLETRSEMFPAFENTLSLLKKKQKTSTLPIRQYTDKKKPLKLYIWIKICRYMMCTHRTSMCLHRREDFGGFEAEFVHHCLHHRTCPVNTCGQGKVKRQVLGLGWLLA